MNEMLNENTPLEQIEELLNSELARKDPTGLTSVFVRTKGKRPIKNLLVAKNEQEADKALEFFARNNLEHLNWYGVPNAVFAEKCGMTEDELQTLIETQPRNYIRKVNEGIILTCKGVDNYVKEVVKYLDRGKCFACMDGKERKLQGGYLAYFVADYVHF